MVGVPFPLTAHRSPLTAPCVYMGRRIYVSAHGTPALVHRSPAHRGGAHPAPHSQLPRGGAAVRVRPAGGAGAAPTHRVAAPAGAPAGGPRARYAHRPVRAL